MRELLQIRWPIAILTMIAATGISVGLSAQATKPTKSERPPFSLTINPTEPVVKSGSNIWIDAAVKNISDHDISVYNTAGHIGFEYNADVWTDKLTMAPETKFGRELHGHRTAEDARAPEAIMSNGAYSPLKPGKISTAHVNVSKMYDLSQPGKYTVQFRRWDEESKTDVKSNKITVTVTP